MKKVAVNIAERSYKIMLDQHILMSVGKQVQTFLKKGNKVALLVSKTVKKLYSERVIRSLITSGYDVDVFLIPSGEDNKNLTSVSELYDKLIKNAYDRSCLILALGGGIVGDISGFVASSLYRGLPFVQLPTTLLSQVDSSVGGKVGVNHAQGKNLIGAFYQPKAVLIDPTVLKTLEVRELICGYGEILKYGFIRDASFLQTCLDNKETIFELKDMELVSEIIRRSVEIKAEIVSEDEKEAGVRMYLNFGHTIGHAIEKSCGYGNFLHGEAVILGMCAALKISIERLGLDAEKGAAAIESLSKIKLGYDINVMDIDNAIMALMHDKKIRDGKLNFVLLNDIGSPEIVNDVTPEMVRETLVWLKECYTNGADL
ncbi:MAG: 3-dehydroquinate synthase [Candidatus Neomarinimicrobiota bacterium]|nr:MAG: 3-dehydroquinate synthase [Candidatus Neomarinimicrobiota bacterium]